MKKLLMILVVFSLTISFYNCSGGSDPAKDSGATKENPITDSSTPTDKGEQKDTGKTTPDKGEQKDTGKATPDQGNNADEVVPEPQSDSASSQPDSATSQP